MPDILCKSYKDSAKKLITSLVEKHGFTLDKVSSYVISGQKREKNVLETVSIHYNLCADTPNENTITVDGTITTEGDVINKTSECMCKHKAQFSHEELIKEGNEIEIIEKCIEHIFTQQKNYLNELQNHTHCR